MPLAAARKSRNARSPNDRSISTANGWPGWLALRKLGRAGDAVDHFKHVRSAAQTPLSQTRGDYWTGRAAEAAGKQQRCQIGL